MSDVTQPEETQDPGQFAWEVYSKAVDGKTYDGKPLPAWKDLGDKQKAGWTAVAVAFIGEPGDQPSANV